MHSSKLQSVTRVAIHLLVVAATLVPASNALAVGLTYVDGDNGANFVINLAPLSDIANSDDPPATNDGKWSYRGDAGVTNPGDFFKSVYEASGGNNPEDVPEISQTLSGLTPNTNYDVYVVYWQGAQAGHNWTVRAGYTSGNLALYNAKGPNATFPDAIAGANALYHDWTSALPTNPTDQQPMFFEDGRTLLLGSLGPQLSDGSGNITVFIDDLPTATGNPDSGSSGARSWFEGLAYAPAGTDVYIAPGDFNNMGGVDAADAHTFLTNMHKDVSSMTVLQTYLLGDLNADKKINYFDFVTFKNLYEADNGGGSFARLMSGVPEPSSGILLILGFAVIAIMFHTRPRRLQFAFQRVVTMNSVVKLFVGCVLACLMSGAAYAVPVTDWFIIAANTGVADPAGKPLSGANTASPVLGETASLVNNSAAQVALWSDITDPLDAGADISLANGQRITLTGSATLTGIVSSMEQFRFGLFNDNSASPFDAFGWGGYMASQSAGTGGGALRAKAYDATTNFAQTGSGVNLQTAQDGDAFTDGTYSFRMAISRFDNELSIDASLTNGTTFTQQWKSAIAASPNFVTFDFNRVGFLSGNPMSADRIEFQNIDVTVDAAEALTLQVVRAGPNAGNVRILNSSAVDFHIDYYEITSALGSLNYAGWNSLDDQELDDPELQGWDEVPESANSMGKLLSEVILQPNTFHTAASSSVFDLGNAFNVGGAEDLKFNVGLSDGTFARGIVQYVDDLVVDFAGDYNDDGAVDAADYVMWRHGQANPTFNLGNDSANPGFDAGDDTTWEANFGNVEGGGSNDSLTAVPEPGFTAMLITGLLAIAINRRLLRSEIR